MVYLVLQKQCQWKLVLCHFYETMKKEVTAEVLGSIEYLKKLYFPTEEKFVDGPSSTLTNDEAHTFIIDEQGDVLDYAIVKMFNLKAWRMAIERSERIIELKEARWYSCVYGNKEKNKSKEKKEKTPPIQSLTLSDRYLFGRINGEVVYPSGDKILARIRWKGNEAIAEPIEPNYAAWLFDRKYLSLSINKQLVCTIDLKAVGAKWLRHGPKGSPNPPNLERIRAFN